MSLDRYDKYVDSGVQWLGDIPEGWEVKRVKDYSYVKGRIGWQGLRSDEFILDSNWYCVTGTDVKNGSIDWSNCYCVEQYRYDQDLKIQLKLNDLLITKDGTIGKIGLVKELPKKSTLNSGVFLTRPLKGVYSNEYMFWVLSSQVFRYFIDYTKNGSTILHLYQNVFERFSYCLPKQIEQKAIAKYLDAKTGAIDKKVALLEGKILRYQELKKSLINESVCRGLNKDVDLRDSGIEWIGDIPSHWELKRLKDIGYLYSGLTGKSGSDFQQDNHINNRPFIPFTNIANNYVIDDNQLGRVLIQEREKQRRVCKNDLFFLMSSEGYEDIGKTSVLLENIGEVYLNSFCKGYRITKDSLDSKFLNYLMHSSSYRKLLSVQGKGFTRINLKMEKVNDFKLYLPNTIKEQKDIVEYLDLKIQKIDSIVSNIKTQILRLKELRKTLINDVVTGQVKVIKC